MLPRRRFHPDDHLSIGVPLNHSHGLACGDMIFVGGQADIGPDARVSKPNDLPAQTRIAMQGMERVLAGLGATLADLVKMTAFYVQPGDIDETKLLRQMAEFFGEAARPGPAVTLVPIETNCFDGLSIEIEGVAMRGQNGEVLPRTAAWIADGSVLPPAFSQALRCGDMIFTSGQTAESQSGEITHPGKLVEQSGVVLQKLAALLAGMGADLKDAVKANVFNVEPGQMESWTEAALLRASYYEEPRAGGDRHFHSPAREAGPHGTQ